MRKTLAGIGALALTALSLAYCNSDQGTGVTVDLAAPGQDLTTATTQDLSAAADLAPAGDAAPAADMTPQVVATEFTVLRIGTGAALTNDATAGFLERRKIADGTLVGQALALPTAAGVANKQITFSGLASNEGQLNRSVDGKYLVVAGYAANPAVKDISTTSSTTVNRVIARVNAASTIETTRTFDAFSTHGVRGVTTTDGVNIWVTSEVGIGYLDYSKTTAPVILATNNVRAIDLFTQNNVAQLFVSTNSTPPGIATVGAGAPVTAAQTVTGLSGFTSGNSPSPYGFVALDRDGNGSIDQIYVADDTLGAKGGVQRWKLVGTTWTLDGTISLGANSGARAVTGYALSGANGVVTLVATTAESTTTAPRIVRLVDTGGATSGIAPTLLATAAANTTYRGIALAPQ